MSKVLRQAEGTRALGGRRIRTFDTRLLAALVVVEIAGGLVVCSSLRIPPLATVMVVAGLVIAQTIALGQWWALGVRANNDAVEALGLDRFDDAERGFLRLVTRRHPRSYTALGLQNLATVAIQRGELTDGALLSRAAMELLSRTRPRTAAEAFSGHIRANYAFALLASGEVDEAEAVLAAPPEPGALAKSHALLVRARSLALVRRQKWQEALSLLDLEACLLRNALTGDEAVLAEVMRAWSLHHLAHPVTLVAVDDDERAFVTRILPGSETVLTKG